VLHVEGVSKTFGKAGERVDAVQDVSLEVQPGEFCVLLGHSGAGKSTLLKILTGQLLADAGRVRVGQRVMSRRTRRSIQHQIGMVHQQFDLVDRLNVLDNVMLGRLPWVSWHRALLRRWRDEERALACNWLERVGLEPAQALRQAGKLSGGQQQRVAIARAFVREPRLVLADEPVASLDPDTGRAVLGLLREAARERGVAVLCSLHQPDFAREFGDRVIRMTQGRVVYNGPPEPRPVDHPSHRVAAAGRGRPAAGIDRIQGGVA